MRLGVVMVVAGLHRSKRGIHETTTVTRYTWSEATSTYVSKTP